MKSRTIPLKNTLEVITINHDQNKEWKRIGANNGRGIAINYIDLACDINKLKYLHKGGIIDASDVEKYMSIRKDTLKNHPYKIYHSDGRWCTYIKDESTKRGSRQVTRKSKEDLEKYLLEYYLEDSKKNNVTLRKLKDEWLKYKATHVSEATIPRVKSDWNRYYQNAEIVDVPLSQLDVLKLDEWVHQNIRKHEMDKRKYHNFALIINQILEYAVAKGYIEDNLFKKVKVDGRRVFFKKEKKESKEEVLTIEGINKLWNCVLPDLESTKRKYGLAPLAALFMIYSGKRISEICALRFDDIISEHKMRVCRMLQRDIGKEGRVVNSTKGGKEHVHYIDLCDGLRIIIMKVYDYRLKHNMPIEGYIFTEGTPDRGLYRAISETYKKYGKALGMPNLSSHKARKTFTSILYNHSNISEEYIRNALDHEKIYMSKEHYLYDTNTESVNLREKNKAFRETIPECVQMCAEDISLKKLIGY